MSAHLNILGPICINNYTFTIPEIKLNLTIKYEFYNEATTTIAAVLVGSRF